MMLVLWCCLGGVLWWRAWAADAHVARLAVCLVKGLAADAHDARLVVLTGEGP